MRKKLIILLSVTACLLVVFILISLFTPFNKLKEPDGELLTDPTLFSSGENDKTNAYDEIINYVKYNSYYYTFEVSYSSIEENPLFMDSLEFKATGEGNLDINSVYNIHYKTQFTKISKKYYDDIYDILENGEEELWKSKIDQYETLFTFYINKNSIDWVSKEKNSIDTNTSNANEIANLSISFNLYYLFNPVDILINRHACAMSSYQNNTNIYLKTIDNTKIYYITNNQISSYHIIELIINNNKIDELNYKLYSDKTSIEIHYKFSEYQEIFLPQTID